jgi:enoyl-CoA hydratase
VIDSEVRDGVRLIWLDRPEKRNALTAGMVARLRDLVGEAAEDAGVRGLVIAGRGPSTCTGVDVAEFARGTPESIRGLITALADACAGARRCPKPVAMAIHGHCYGGALELACACDLRVAAEGALLAMPEVRFGIPSVIDAALIERHVGLGRAQELILTGRPITAEQALAWGLLNRVVPADRLMATCLEVVDGVTVNDAAAVARQKRLFGAWHNLPLDEAIERSKEELVESFADGVPQRLAREWLDAPSGPGGPPPPQGGRR